MILVNNISQLGLFVRETRKMQGLTQEQLAVTSGVGVRFIRELEQGKETCQIGKAFNVISMLGFNVVLRCKDFDVETNYLNKLLATQEKDKT